MIVLRCVLFKRDSLDKMIFDFPMADDSPATCCNAYFVAKHKAKFFNAFIDSMKIIDIG